MPAEGFLKSQERGPVFAVPDYLHHHDLNIVSPRIIPTQARQGIGINALRIALWLMGGLINARFRKTSATFDF